MMTDDQTRPLTTYAEAEKVNAYELARRWGEFPARLKGEEPDAGRELEELAVMAALREWLSRWTAVQIHRALLTGATVYQVAAAAGVTVAEAAETWREWDAGQRQLWQTHPNMDRATEHDQVATVLYHATLAESPRTGWTKEAIADALSAPDE